MLVQHGCSNAWGTNSFFKESKRTSPWKCCHWFMCLWILCQFSSYVFLSLASFCLSGTHLLPLSFIRACVELTNVWSLACQRACMCLHSSELKKLLWYRKACKDTSFGWHFSWLFFANIAKTSLFYCRPGHCLCQVL